MNMLLVAAGYIATLILASSSFASSSLSDSEARRLVNENIREFRITIPDGVIRLRSGLDPDTRSDPKNRSYPWSYLETLQRHAKGGLITLQELPPQGMEMLTKPFQITLTAGAAAAVVNRDEWGRPQIRGGERAVTRIVRNTEWKHTSAGNDEYRLVLGVYDFTPATIYSDYEKRLGRTMPKSYKFRALLKYDPFKETYKFAVWDWGDLEKDTWFSSNVPN